MIYISNSKAKMLPKWSKKLICKYYLNNFCKKFNEFFPIFSYSPRDVMSEQLENEISNKIFDMSNLNPSTSVNQTARSLPYRHPRHSFWESIDLLNLEPLKKVPLNHHWSEAKFFQFLNNYFPSVCYNHCHSYSHCDPHLGWERNDYWSYTTFTYNSLKWQENKDWLPMIRIIGINLSIHRELGEKTHMFLENKECSLSDFSYLLYGGNQYEGNSGGASFFLECSWEDADPIFHKFPDDVGAKLFYLIPKEYE